MSAASRPVPPTEELLLLGEAVTARLSDAVWHNAACQRAAAQLVLAKVAGMTDFGNTWVPMLKHRPTYESGWLGPGMAGLGRTPAQAAAIAVAGGQHAAHQVFSSALTAEEARAVSARWAEFDERHHLRHLAEPWDWDHAVHDARALSAESAVREEIEFVADDLGRGLQIPHGDVEDVPEVQHRIWMP
ncbi:hypothetical protein ABZ249_12170 [Nocardiopsis sp. NPDC006139]|uniref:hypothetical protein n=1 Tax=Nocardiopsis sp. NPDC006139 TaxID=3154578 RepID=UPI0033AB2301